MPKVSGYRGSTELMSGVTQANGQGYALMEANAIQVDENDKRLDEKLNEIEGQLGVQFTTDNSLSMSEDGVLSVNVTDEASEDNTLPITSSAVHTIVGNIEVLLNLI